MRSYAAYIAITLRLTLRDKAALFFTYIFPLVFFFILGQSVRAEQGGVITQVVTMVLILAVLGNGLFGAGVRTVQERELNILRRFKVTPISPAPILVGSMVTGWVVFIPAALLTLALARIIYGMPIPVHLLSLLVLVSLGVVAFRALGLIVASVVNSAQESAILTQLLYLPMLFLSGAVFPIAMLPDWAQVLVQLLPASYLSTGFQGIMLNNETLGANWAAIIALILTTLIATFLSMKLFRWEKEEKLPASAKLWVLAVLAPFIVLGTYQAHSRDNVDKAKQLYRDLRRSRNFLIRDARIFVGDGRVIEPGSVLVRNGKVAEIFEGKAPNAKALRAEAVEAAGKTLLPGLIDAHVHIAGPGGIYADSSKYQPQKATLRALAAYLYCGVTTVKSAGDPLDMSLEARSKAKSRGWLGAELFVSGPIFTTERGYGTEAAGGVSDGFRLMVERQSLRLPKTPQEADRQVADLKRSGVDGIVAVLETSYGGRLFNRMEDSVLQALVLQAHAEGLPAVVHTGDATDVRDAVKAGADGIEYGSSRDLIPEEVFAQMARNGVVYDPVLSAVEAVSDFVAGNPEWLDRSLVQQVGPKELIQGTNDGLRSVGVTLLRKRLGEDRMDPAIAMENLRRAYKAGVVLVAGSDGGNYFVVHGPGIHRELQLWVRAGIPSETALQGATYNAARLLRAEHRFGVIQKGFDANLLLVDGNPLQEIGSTERISMVVFKGEPIVRAGLLGQDGL
jgi:imidazolonepropionase-like amidohydrolase/ABC-type multidrug transport system permease subunit